MEDCWGKAEVLRARRRRRDSRLDLRDWPRS